MPHGKTLALWLRRELPRHGYNLEGTRAGGMSRFADDSGVSRPSVSRLLSGTGGEPSLDTLQAFGRALGYSLGQMLVNAGYLDREELKDLQEYAESDVHRDLRYPDHPEYQAIWDIPQLNEEEKQAAIYGVIAYRFDPRRGGADTSSQADGAQSSAHAVPASATSASTRQVAHQSPASADVDDRVADTA